jgi:phage tail P2-like protein
MPDPVKRINLLPPSNATPRERAHADTDGRLDDRRVESATITTLKDPATCPAALLPYLAWERSVDVWDPAWPEATKRAVIAAAPDVHRHKGTVYAVKAVLGALQVDADVTEWWQETPKAAPYTFKVIAQARARLYDGPLLDARLIKSVFSAVMRVKPLSRAFDLTVAANMPGALGAAGIGVARSVVRVPAYADNSETFSAPLGAAGVAVARSVVRASMVSLPDV